MPNRTAGRLLRDARRGAGLSQRALAEKAGIPQSTIARIELAIVSPRVDTLERLLRLIGQTLATEPRLGAGVDRSVIRALRQLTPAERMSLGPASGTRFREFERAARRRDGLPELGVPRSMDIDELEHLAAVREEVDDGR